jgi:hypothetical protein
MSLTCRSAEPPIGIEPMTYALRGACALPVYALAAPIAPTIALTALAALGLSDDPVHEPVHARGLSVLSSFAVRDLAEDTVSARERACRVMGRRFTDRRHTWPELRICSWRLNFAAYSPELREMAASG